MSLKDRVIERFGNKAFSLLPTFSNNEGALRFELGAGDDSLSYKITALHRFNTLLDDLGFKHHPIGIAAYCYTYDSTADETHPPIHQQLLPFARELSTWGGIKFCRSEYIRIQEEYDKFIPDTTNSFTTFLFGETTIDQSL